MLLLLMEDFQDDEEEDADASCNATDPWCPSVNDIFMEILRDEILVVVISSCLEAVWILDKHEAGEMLLSVNDTS